MRHFAPLLLSCALAMPLSALAQGSVQNKVVGWKADGSVIVRTELTVPADNGDDPDETSLFLTTYAPGAGRVVQTWHIQGPGESQATRGANWKAAEAELVAGGYTIVPTAPVVELSALGGGVTWSTTSVRDDDYRYTRLVVTRGEQSAVLDASIETCCFGGNTATFAGPWKPPGERWLCYVGNTVGNWRQIVWIDMEAAKKKVTGG